MNWLLHSLRIRLMLTYIILIVLGFGGLALLAGRQISEGVKQDFASRLEIEALLMASALHESLEELHDGETNQKSIINQLATLTEKFNVNVALLDSKGYSSFNSTQLLPSEDLSGLPEVASALNQDVSLDLRPNEEGIPTLYAAAAVVDHNKAIGIVHLSVPAGQAEEEINRRWLALGFGVAVMTLIALVTSLWLSRSLTQPLLRLRNFALKLAKGDFSERFREQRRDEIGQLAQSLNYMADEVQAMLDEQRAFASNASHELRTPLTTIGLRTELLRSGELDEATIQRYINEIDQEVGRLNGLVDDLIWLSRFEANRVTRGEEQFDPVRLASVMLRELEAKATARQIEMKLEPSLGLPPIQANRNHLHIVFRNLLDNAIKYTPDGGQVKWLLKQEDDKLYAIVSDTGRGIAKEELPHIGKRFFRSDKARTREIKGIGLGLSLVRLVVEFYGGQFKINSPGLGQGTTVEVWWPFKQKLEQK